MDPEIFSAPKTDFYLRFSSPVECKTALAAFYHQEYTRTVDPETGEETQTPLGESYLVAFSPDYSIDLVGIIQEPTGNIITSADGFEYPEMAPVPGYHVNIRLTGEARRAEVEELDALYGVNPKSPSRVWL